MNRKMKSILALASMSMLSSAMGGDMPEKYVEPEETDEEREKRLERAKDKINKSQGLTLFLYGENKLWALNQKSADKKAQKKHWL